jgi:hypothetical protein
MAARPQQPRQGSRALAHYLPRALYPAWIQGLRVERMLCLHRRDPDPTRSDLARSRCRARGVAPPRARDARRSPTPGASGSTLLATKNGSDGKRSRAFAVLPDRSKPAFVRRLAGVRANLTTPMSGRRHLRCVLVGVRSRVCSRRSKPRAGGRLTLAGTRRLLKACGDMQRRQPRGSAAAKERGRLPSSLVTSARSDPGWILRPDPTPPPGQGWYPPRRLSARRSPPGGRTVRVVS